VGTRKCETDVDNESRTRPQQQPARPQRHCCGR